MRNTTLKALVLAVGMGLYGCGNKEVQENYNSEYNSAVTTYTEPAYSELEGKIIKVQPSQLSYCGDDDKQAYGSSISSTHEFEYVLLKDSSGVHTLVYPYSKAIMEGNAKIKYRPVTGGSIDAEKFIDLFLKEKYFTDDNFQIETQGFIVKDGIQYTNK